MSITTKQPTLLEELRAWNADHPAQWRLQAIKGPFLRTIMEAYIQHRQNHSGAELRERMRGYCDGAGTVPDWCFGERYADALNLFACHFDRWWRRRELGK